MNREKLHQVIVCEAVPRWEPELQRQFQGTEVAVRACRAVAELERLLAKHPQSVALLDLAVGPAACLQFLGRRVARGSRSAVVVLGDTTTAELEWPLRELGAVEFLNDIIAAHEMARICRTILNSDSHATTS